MPRLQWLEISGFRAFAETQRFDFQTNLALVWAPNSQGKTSVAEAIEFLLTGITVRREILGGAKAEFDSSLRNAHISAGAPVWVKAGLLDDQGAAHEVCRSLVADYSGDRECSSRLTIDNNAADDLSGLGFALADPPLRAPVLLQHTLRFALSARPQDRADYFKSVLEVQDLEKLRDLVSDQRERVELPAPTPIARLRLLGANPDLADISRAIEQGRLRSSELSTKLELAVDLAAARVGASTEGLVELSAKVAALRSALDTSRERTFPVGAHRPGDPVPALESGPLDDLRTYSELAAEVDAEAERLRALYEAVLAVPSIAGAHDPIDCPVCGTPEALDPERIADMRRRVAEARGLRAAEAAAASEVGALKGRLGEVRRSATRLLPVALGMGEDERAAHARAAAGLLGMKGSYPLDVEALQPLVEAHDSLVAAIDSVDACLAAAESGIRNRESVDVDDLRTELQRLSDAIEASRISRQDYAAAAAALLEPIRQAVDRQQGIDVWVQLVQLAADPAALREALLEQRARSQVARDLGRAITDIDKAKAEVFDQKFEGMSSEIDRWWSLLRPDESVRFDSVRRRGTGRRFVMFKARLQGRRGTASVERDALGIFSDSQLNALGLASFLARSRLQGSPLVVLDDPLQAGDDEHRATFVAYVLDELLKQGAQVIVLSYDDMTSKLMHHRYEHLPLDGFALTLDNPERGALVAKASNTAEALLQRAGTYLGHDVPEFRELAATKLRQAAERTAKEIIVQGRLAAGEKCSLADYEDQTLGPLIRDLGPHLNDPSHPGKWRVVGDLLNPGTHDDAPPTRNDLKTAHGYLKEFVKHYMRRPAMPGEDRQVDAPRLH